MLYKGKYAASFPLYFSAKLKRIRKASCIFHELPGRCKYPTRYIEKSTRTGLFLPARETLRTRRLHDDIPE